MFFPEIFKIQEIGTGFLAIMAKPRAGEWLEDEFLGLKSLGITSITSMLESAEAYEIGLQSEFELCNKNEIEFLSFPIPDRGLPSNIESFVKLAGYLHKEIKQGSGVVIHCRGGIGRCSLLAATILLREGNNTEEALEKISLARRVKVPDTEEQIFWLKENERILRNKI